MLPERTLAEVVQGTGYVAGQNSYAAQLHATGEGTVTFVLDGVTSSYVVDNPLIVWNGLLRSPDWERMVIQVDVGVQLGVLVDDVLAWEMPYVEPEPVKKKGK